MATLVPQSFFAATRTLPDALPTGTFTLTKVVPWPSVMTQFAGNSQMYSVAYNTDEILYTIAALPSHTELIPVTVPGVAGVVITVITTSDVFTVQGPLLMVHLKV